MILEIDENKTISELQDKFTECFPDFKIDFFKDFHALKENQPAEGFLRISEITHKHNNGEIRISSSDRAEKIIHDFKSQLGLLVEIYKRHSQTFIPLNGNETLKTAFVPGKKKNAPAKSNEEEEADYFFDL